VTDSVLSSTSFEGSASLSVGKSSKRSVTSPTIRVRLDAEMAAWLESLVADERYELVREMKENRDSLGHDDPVRLSEVRLAEKVLRYVRGSMMEAGWEHG